MSDQLPLSQRTQTLPATNLDDAYKLCDPWTPLEPHVDDKLREDFKASRGGDRLQNIVRGIRRAGASSTLQFLGGAVGSGKTTELLRMIPHLELAHGGEATNTVLYLDASSSLDMHNLDLEDIVIALWGLIYKKQPKAAAKALTPIWKEQVKDVFGPLVVNFPSEASQAISSLTRHLKLPGVDQGRQLRVAIGSVLAPLIDGLNRALEVIREDAAGSVIVLIDNLEKVEVGAQTNVEHLYLVRMSMLRDLGAHFIITMPYHLCYEPNVGMAGDKVVVLPSIKIRERCSAGGKDAKEGLAEMTELLLKRVDFEALFEGGKETAEHIARLSGGCIRHALRMVRDAINEHDEAPVTRASVNLAVGRLQGHFERALRGSWVPALLEVGQKNQFPDHLNEETKRLLLRHLFVLEYQNGGPHPWHAVHPIVERCKLYQNGLDGAAG